MGTHRGLPDVRLHGMMFLEYGIKAFWYPLASYLGLIVLILFAVAFRDESTT